MSIIIEKGDYMSAKRMKRFNFLIGLFSFLSGCCLLISIADFNRIIERTGGIVTLCCFIVFAVSLFYISINSFIKYGISLGIDYALEQKYKEELK